MWMGMGGCPVLNVDVHGGSGEVTLEGQGRAEAG